MECSRKLTGFNPFIDSGSTADFRSTKENMFLAATLALFTSGAKEVDLPTDIAAIINAKTTLKYHYIYIFIYINTYKTFTITYLLLLFTT